MISIEPFLETFKDSRVRKFLHQVNQQIPQLFSDAYHGDFTKWKKALDQIIHIQPRLPAKGDFDLNASAVRIGSAANSGIENKLVKPLEQFMPWRKGPYSFFGIEIDCEWRSDWKWDRLKNEIASLKGRSVLDIGCGNGYHCWRMIGTYAHRVLGVDPMLHYVMQFQLFNHYLRFDNIQVLPLAVENLPQDLFAFDTVFSMGVLYHRRSPMDHLLELRNFTSPSGELVLETLVIDGEDGKVLVPRGRYAKMRNVWFIPSVLTLENWLKRCGFKNIRVIDTRYTSIKEQRVTRWMTYESLEHFLDPDDPHNTIEGYPAPKRAIIICN